MIGGTRKRMKKGEARLLSEGEGYTILAQYGIPVPDHEMARTAQEAAEIAERIGFPVVLKVVSPQVVHKSDIGGVITGVNDGRAVEEAFTTIKTRLQENNPSARLDGVMVEKEMPQGLEMIIGGKVDPSFGRILTVGLGGTLVELLSDVSLRILPLNREEVQQMIQEIRGYPLIHGYRGEVSKDEETLMDSILAVQNLFLSETAITEFDLNPLFLYKKGCVAVDARIYWDEDREPVEPPMVEDISPDLFRPRSIAVVGASSDPNKLGYVIFRNLLSFSGDVYPVNPHHKEILGRKAYPSVSEIPSFVDMVMVAVPAPIVLPIIREAGKKGIPVAIVISAGFKETGEEGKRREEELMAAAREGGVRILGPNCLGVMLPHQSINATFDPVTPLKGSIGFVSQSGAVVATVVDWSIPEGIGFSAVVSIGNQADLGFDEFLKILEADDHTRAIILYIEEIINGREFLDVVSRVSERKPVVAIKSGSSQRGKTAAASHTGSLAGAYEVYQAAFRQSGVITASSLQDAFHVAELLSSQGYPQGTRTIVITSAGGFAVLASDAAERHGVELVELPDPIIEEMNQILPSTWNHQNPMDLVGDAGADRFARVFDLMLRHQDLWDIAVVIAVPSPILDINHLAQEIVRFSEHTHRMIVGCLLGGDSMKSGVWQLREHGIPNFSDLEDAFLAVGRACSYRHQPAFRK
jgi:acetyl coenzyme A synthetase (ADP forming)-like protein